MHLMFLSTSYFILSLARLSTSSPLSLRQQPEYFDGYGYLTFDVFSIDLYSTGSSATTIERLLNISTSFGGTTHQVICPSPTTNSTIWLEFPSPTVPGTASSNSPGTPVLQGDIRLLPGKFCDCENGPEDSFDGTMLDYQGDQVVVATGKSECARWSGQDGQLDDEGPLARCVFALTPP